MVRVLSAALAVTNDVVAVPLLAWTLMALLTIHLLAVLHHDVMRRDGIFRRMWPFVLLLVSVLVIAMPGRPVLAQSNWTIDPAKSRIAFSVEQVGKIASGRIGRRR